MGQSSAAFIWAGAGWFSNHAYQEALGADQVALAE